MVKSLVIFSLFSVALLADTSLGTPIGNSATLLQKSLTDKPIKKKKADKTPTLKSNNALTTRITPKKVKSNFRKDDHRYDKRYSNFDYESEGYYNDDGYYYGYYDNRGYFYDNIFYAYDDQYTYYDRRHRIGHFAHHYHHYRPYVYHSFNRWNRIHCYREPNVIVYGHYYERPYLSRPPINYYYPAYDSRYSNYYSPASRMVTRHNEYYAPRHYNNSSHYYNHYNSSRMSTNHSYSRGSYSSHRNVSRMQIAR